MKSLLLDSLYIPHFFFFQDILTYYKLDGGKKGIPQEKLMIAILQHWELASVLFYYSLWQHHHRQRHPGKKKIEWTGERGQMRGWSVSQASKQQAAKSLSPSLFLLGVNSKLFPSDSDFFFLFLFRFTAQLPHQGRLAQECILTLFPGVLAEHHTHWRVE